MRDRYGATKDRSLQLRFHTQTAGVSLTAQQPQVNLVRVAIEALAGVLGGTQSLHTDAFDEALALPTEHAARLALRTQQVIAEESGVVHVADPLGGSWFVEELTDELERQAEDVFAHLLEAGAGSVLDGVIACVDDGWFVSEIAEAAYAFQSKIARDEWKLVGVNAYVEGEGAAPPTLSIDPAVETDQLARLAAIKQARDDDAVRRTLGPRGDRRLRPRRQPHARADRGGGRHGDRRRGDAGARNGVRHLHGAPGRLNVASGNGEAPLRVLMAKVGLDGHDRGLRVVARILRDAGCEVVYAGLRQSPETIAAMTAQEDVDVVGVSMHNGAHLTLAPAVVDALRAAGLDTPVVVGGIVPPDDVATLLDHGVAAVLGPGASNDEVVACVRAAAGVGPIS